MKNEPNVVVVSEEPPALTADEYKALVALKPHHTIHYDDAKQQAIEAVNLFNNDPTTKSMAKSILDGRAITSYALGLTKSEAIDVDTLIYLFNYANDEGYVFVSADERAPGILAYIEKGYFNVLDSIECPGTAMLFSGMEVLVRQEIARAEFLKDSLGETVTAKYDAITKSSNLSTKGANGAADGSSPTIGTREETVYKAVYSNMGVTRTVLSSSTTMHVHCNMGNGESYNGYYIDGVFNTNDLPEVNTKSEAEGNYQYKVEVAPRIRPE